MTDTTFRWCFIGTGHLAEKVAKEITASGKHSIVSVYARRQEPRNAFAKEYGAKSYDSAAAAMLDENVDGVYIVTPHTSHFEYAKMAVEFGKPVLCEKPFTVNNKQALELIALAKEKNVYLVEAMWTWFSPIANQIKAWMDSGKFGDITEFKLHYRQDFAPRGGRLVDPNLAGGALLDIGVYAITYLYRLFGMPTAITCTGDVRGGVDYSEDITMTFPNGVTYEASVAFDDPEGEEVLIIKGTKGSVTIPWFHFANEVAFVGADGTEEVFTGDGSMLNEFNLVAEEIRAGLTESKYVPHQATLDVLELMDACREQMELRYPGE